MNFFLSTFIASELLLMASSQKASPQEVVPSCSGQKSCPHGMTWTKKASDDIGGSITVGCHGFGTSCDPYIGDTGCYEERPLLCFYPLGAPMPAWIVESMWYQWTGGVVATTPPVAPATAGLSTIASADSYCESTFGPGWRVAEHHDGSGWNFHAYGGVGGVEEDRFWVHIDDQVDGNCWSL